MEESLFVSMEAIFVSAGIAVGQVRDGGLNVRVDSLIMGDYNWMGIWRDSKVMWEMVGWWRGIEMR